MNFLKGLVISLLSFLLFLSLSIFGDALTIKYTLLNPDFVVSQVDRLDIASLAEELLSEQIQLEEEFVAEILRDTVADLEPWMKEQATTLIYSGYDYLMGRDQSLSLSIPLKPVEDSLKDSLRQVLLQSLPPELAGAPQELIDQFINEAYQQISDDIPETFEFNESSWGLEVQNTLEQARQAIGYFELGFKILIGFMLLLITSIFLMSRPIRTAIRNVGIIFLSYGVLQFVGIFILTWLAGTQLTQSGLPLALQTWLPQFLNDLFTPLKIFTIGIAIIGVILIIVGVVRWGQKPMAQQQVPGAWQSSVCPRCGSQCGPGQRFCAACGATLTSICPGCGVAIDPISRFCPNCGGRLG